MVKSDKWKYLGNSIELKSGDILIEPGVIPTCCYYIESGMIAAYMENQNGLKNTYGIFQNGDIILEQDLLRAKENVLYYETIGKVRARKITGLQLEQALREEPLLYRDMLNIVMKFGDGLLEQSISRENGNAASKLSHLLLKLAGSYGVEEDGRMIIDLKMSQELLAQLAGLHRITVVREMKKMQERNLVSKKMRWYVIPNVMKLTEYRNEQMGVAV